jgi:hypothetical protein
MPVNGRDPEEKDCTFRLKLILFPYRGTVLVINLLGGSHQEIFVKPNSIESYCLFKNTFMPGLHNEILPSAKLSVNGLMICTRTL